MIAVVKLRVYGEDGAAWFIARSFFFTCRLSICPIRAMMLTFEDQIQTGSGKSWVIRPRWTGGQYSLYRILFAVYLIALFATIVAGRANLVSIMSATIGIVAGVSLLVGLFDRAAAMVVAVAVWLIIPLHPAWPGMYITVMLTSLLAFHMCQPPRPYGSWAAGGHLDSSGGWRMSPFIYAVAWAWMAVGYTSWGGCCYWIRRGNGAQ